MRKGSFFLLRKIPYDLPTSPAGASSARMIGSLGSHNLASFFEQGRLESCPIPCLANPGGAGSKAKSKGGGWAPQGGTAGAKSDSPLYLFAGLSNSGKSSLINRVLSADFCSISKRPGHTFLLYLFGAKVGAGEIVVVDGPGYGRAEREKSVVSGWFSLMKKFMKYVINRKGVVVMVVDCGRGIQPEDRVLIEGMTRAKKPILVCLTKADRVSPDQIEKAIREVGEIRGGVLPFGAVTSATRGEGIGELVALMEFCGRFDREVLIDMCKSDNSDRLPPST